MHYVIAACAPIFSAYVWYYLDSHKPDFEAAERAWAAKEAVINNERLIKDAHAAYEVQFGSFTRK